VALIAYLQKLGHSTPVPATVARVAR